MDPLHVFGQPIKQRSHAFLTYCSSALFHFVVSQIIQEPNRAGFDSRKNITQSGCAAGRRARVCYALKANPALAVSPDGSRLFLTDGTTGVLVELLPEFERAIGFDENNFNKEIQFAWLDLAVTNRFDPAVPLLERFLTSQGRGKFVKPLIKALASDQAWGRSIAMRIYAKARPLYHPTVTRDLDPLHLLDG